MQVFWRVFWRLIRIKLIAVGLVFVGIGAILALLGFSEGSYVPASGVVVSAERSGSGYDAMVNVTSNGVSTPVEMKLYRTKFGRAPEKGDKLQLLQSPTNPNLVSQVLDTGSRFRDMAVFWGVASLMLWLGFGGKLPKRKPKLSVPVMAPAKAYTWQQASEAASPIVDYSRARAQQPVVVEGRRAFGRR